MDEAQADKLRQANITGSRLFVLAQHPEFEELVKIMREEHDNCYRQMLNSNGSLRDEAIGGMKVIDSFFEKIGSKINYGEKCRAKLWATISKVGVPAGI